MPPRPKKPSEKAKASNILLEAITFLSAVTSDTGAPQDTHIFLGNKFCTASNGVLSAGFKINDEIISAPNAKLFKQALSKCGDGYTLSIDGTRIIVKSGAFKAVVPCIDPNLLSIPEPDAPVADIDDRFKAALEIIDIIKSDNGQRVELLSFLMNGQSVIGTDGKIIIEYWHGIELPTNLPVPKIIIPAIVGSGPLAKFGYSHSSVTFWFANGSWIKSQLYNAQWPVEQCLSVLNKQSVPSAIPPDFFKALDAVASFSDHGTVHFERELLCSHKQTNIGATHDVPGLPKGPIYTAKYLQMIKGFAEKIDFTVSANGSVHSENASGYLLFFFGKQIRGVIAGHG